MELPPRDDAPSPDDLDLDLDQAPTSPSMIIRATRFSLGAAPGTPQFERGAKPPSLQVIAYSPAEVQEAVVDHVGALHAYLKAWPVVWLNVEGVDHQQTLEQLVDLFGIHKLAFEDIVHQRQRPKLDNYGDQLFIVCRMFSRVDDVQGEQLSLVLGPNFLVTFQEKRDGDCLDPVRERIRRGGRVRRYGADYLAYSLLDAVIDYYFPLLEAHGDQLCDLEEAVLAAPSQRHVPKIHRLRRDLLIFRRAAWPLREVVHGLIRDAPPDLVTDEARLYLRDCYDHVVQIVDLIETYRELASGLMDIYLSQTSQQMNAVMRTLTVISTIFIPLTFIAGVYGMNFNPDASGWNMPELNAPYGYVVTMALMALMAGGMMWVFWRKGWLGERSQAAMERRRAREDEAASDTAPR
jgi:magnesium transporter